MSRYLRFTVYTSSSYTSIFVCYAKHSKCDVIVNRCFWLKKSVFFQSRFSAQWNMLWRFQSRFSAQWNPPFRRRPSCPLQKGAQYPIFGPCLLWPKVCMDQDATCVEVDRKSIGDKIPPCLTPAKIFNQPDWSMHSHTAPQIQYVCWHCARYKCSYYY